MCNWDLESKNTLISVFSELSSQADQYSTVNIIYILLDLKSLNRYELCFIFFNRRCLREI